MLAVCRFVLSQDARMPAHSAWQVCNTREDCFRLNVAKLSGLARIMGPPVVLIGAASTSGMV